MTLTAWSASQSRVTPDVLSNSLLYYNRTPSCSVAGSPPKGGLCYYQAVAHTNFSIEGFNLYYRAVKGTIYKWLDLEKLCQLLVPRDTVNKIRCFTAIVDSTSDPQAPVRQLTYLRALATIPNLTITKGQFRTDRKRKPLARPLPGTLPVVEVLDNEEKGSDVNLGAYLLADGYESDYEQAIVV